jgi:HSP90 family molecular chaperone
MKIAVNADAESTVVGVESGRMNFDTSKQAKLFHMLSSSLYSNKPRSILRELASNAHDSHVQAGIAATTPFKSSHPPTKTLCSSSRTLEWG